MKLRTIPIRNKVTYDTGLMELAWIQWLRDLVDFIRMRPIEDVNLYVRTDGKDANEGMDNHANQAVLTLQKAIDIYQALDTRGYDITINIADGAYTAGALIESRIGHGTLTIVGNVADPSAVTVTVDDGHCFEITGHPSTVILKGMTLVTTTSGSGIVASNGAHVQFESMIFGACIDYHVLGQEGALVEATGNYTITGGAVGHWYMDHAELGHPATAPTVTLTGTPAFTGWFAAAVYLGLIDCRDGWTFTGSASGARYLADANGVINTAGSGATYLPGDAGGSATNGGQYI